MKLVRYGRAGAERPGLIDEDGGVGDLSRVVDDITPETLSSAGLKHLRAVKPATSQPGDVVEMGITGLGAPRNRIAAR
jgi:hypothetical protein